MSNCNYTNWLMKGMRLRVDICLKGNKRKSLLFRVDAPQNAQIEKFLLALSKWIVG